MNSDEQEYSRKLHALIPGGAHTYSRGDDQYPDNAPRILERGEGARVWGADGTEYLDYGMGLRSVTVGYNDRSISEAAVAEIHKGNTLARPTLTELHAAEAITSLIPNADMVKFAKNGSTVTTAAVKLARAYNRRKYIAICVQHPFFSYDDWFIGATILKRGVPEENASLTLKFHYNDIASLQALFDQYPDQISAVIMEPATIQSPMIHGEGKPGFLHQVSDLCRKNGAVYILDEMITGFRWHEKGAQAYFKVDADLITFGKGMANGFSLAALVGKREIMEIAGIQKEGVERVFLASSTHGAEMCSLGAFVRTIQVYKERSIVEKLWSYGDKLISGMNAIARTHGIEKHFMFEGFSCSPAFSTKDASGQVSLAFRTLFLQEMTKHRVLIPWVAISAAHGDKELDWTLTAAEKALKVYAQALESGIDRYLTSKVIKPVFRQYN